MARPLCHSNIWELEAYLTPYHISKVQLFYWSSSLDTHSLGCLLQAFCFQHYCAFNLSFIMGNKRSCSNKQTRPVITFIWTFLCFTLPKPTNCIAAGFASRWIRGESIRCAPGSLSIGIKSIGQGKEILAVQKHLRGVCCSWGNYV